MAAGGRDRLQIRATRKLPQGVVDYYPGEKIEELLERLSHNYVDRLMQHNRKRRGALEL